MLLTLLIAVLGFVVIAGVGFALAGGSGSADAKTLKRAQAIVGGDARESRRRPVAAQDQRRKQILKTLRDQDRQQKKATLSLSARLQQAGLGISVQTFWVISVVVGVLVFGVAIILKPSPLIALGLAFASGLGLPRWVVGFIANRRIKKFTSDFPDAMDIIVRGIRSGLPVHDSLRVIAQESSEPLASQFNRLVESLSMGASVDQALEKMHENMPTPEVRFFSIVLAIQQKTGGNLAEALANLSTVIRARKLMREKAKALSGEAVASAAIIGSLPPVVATLISITAPDYMRPLFTDPRGHLMLMAGAFWMTIGVLSMRKMINFKM
ncbi:type II secretion system F family protein [Phenylobacterium sp.]|uniref:type II secretion system F family protein n=1 Tax=Phenylobacterium sp. TaxID=1871053 RepID=UPI00272FB9DC|nr:type II secretion system F family protein [Phenylobacterium sp.]MDP1600642.1 type II secretion system F family protein [Phenylobacterium sp.]MDP3593017.1 type II secretion system F family protein [Phenylobacterium sp.]